MFVGRYSKVLCNWHWCCLKQPPADFGGLVNTCLPALQLAQVDPENLVETSEKILAEVQQQLRKLVTCRFVAW